MRDPLLCFQAVHNLLHKSSCGLQFRMRHDEIDVSALRFTAAVSAHNRDANALVTQLHRVPADDVRDAFHLRTWDALEEFVVVLHADLLHAI